MNKSFYIIDANQGLPFVEYLGEFENYDSANDFVKTEYPNENINIVSEENLKLFIKQTLRLLSY